MPAATSNRGPSSPLPPRSGGEGSGVGGSAAITEAVIPAERPPTPDPSPPRAMRVEGGEKKDVTCRVASEILLQILRGLLGRPLEVERRDELAVAVHQIDQRGVIHGVVAILQG